MRAQNHNNVLADFAQQVVETVALAGVEAGGRLVHDDEQGLADEGLGNAEALLHATRERADAALAHVVEVGLLQQGLYRVAPLATVYDALHHGHVVEQVFGRHPRVHPKLLGQVAQHPAQGHLILQRVDSVEVDAAAVGGLQRGNGAHQAAFAGAVGPEQAEHALRNGQAHVVERLHPVGVGFRQIFDGQFHYF